MTTLERVGAAVMIGDKVVAIWMRGSWYSLIKGDYDVVTDPDKIREYSGAPVARSERAAHRIRMLDALKVVRNTKRTHT